MAYNLGLAVLVLIVTWIFVHLEKEAVGLAWSSQLAVVALAVLLGGMHEVLTIAILPLALMGAIFPRDRSAKSRTAWISLVVSLVVGLAINVVAPGNAARLDVMGSPTSAVRVVPAFFGQVHHHFLPCLTDLGTWLALYLWADVLGERHFQRDPPDSPPSVNPHGISLAVVVAGTVFVLCSLLAVPAAIYGNWTPGRLGSAYHIVFLVLCALVAAHATRVHGDLLACVRGLGWYPTARAVAVMLFAVSLYAGGWLASDLYDLFKRAPSYHSAMTANYDTLSVAAHGGQRRVQVHLVRDWPRAYLPDDGEAVYGRYWRELSVVSFFGRVQIERTVGVKIDVA